MSILETFVLALQNVFTSKMRTFLTMLGIIIGVAAVIVIVGAAVTALAIYFVIVFLLWLVGRAVNKARIKGRHCQ